MKSGMTSGNCLFDDVTHLFKSWKSNLGTVVDSPAHLPMCIITIKIFQAFVHFN